MYLYIDTGPYICTLYLYALYLYLYLCLPLKTNSIFPNSGFVLPLSFYVQIPFLTMVIFTTLNTCTYLDISLPLCNILPSSLLCSHADDFFTLTSSELKSNIPFAMSTPILLTLYGLLSSTLPSLLDSSHPG